MDLITSQKFKKYFNNFLLCYEFLPGDWYGHSHKTKNNWTQIWSICLLSILIRKCHFIDTKYFDLFVFDVTQNVKNEKNNLASF